MDEIRYAPIGVFDSGVGGLTVAREMVRQMPTERIIYFGDTARVPYGSKSRETVVRYSRQIVHFLTSKGVKAIVAACNTASALALEELTPETEIPLIGVVIPGARAAAEATKNGRIGVIATESTIASGLYPRVITEFHPGAKVYGKACPLFVPLVEEGWITDPVTREVAKRYLDPLLETGIDTLVLGCTHYPLLCDLLLEVLGDGVQLVNPAYETARELKRLLVQKGMANDGAKTEAGADGLYRFYVSDEAARFRSFANSILPFWVDRAKLVAIEDF